MVDDNIEVESLNTPGIDEKKDLLCQDEGEMGTWHCDHRGVNHYHIHAKYAFYGAVICLGIALMVINLKNVVEKIINSI